MTGRPLTDKEKADYVAGGFRLEGPPRSEAKALRDRLALARRLLKGWGADAKATRAVLAASSARTLAHWQSGEAPIPAESLERVEVVLGLYRRLLQANDAVDVRPLPPLRRPGQMSLPARDLLAGGRLSDLLALWRQLVLTEEAADREPMQYGRTTTRHCGQRRRRATTQEA